MISWSWFMTCFIVLALSLRSGCIAYGIFIWPYYVLRRRAAWCLNVESMPNQWIIIDGWLRSSEWDSCVVKTCTNIWLQFGLYSFSLDNPLKIQHINILMYHKTMWRLCIYIYYIYWNVNKWNDRCPSSNVLMFPTR